ncbi:MAG: DUF3179 domain-containing protein [Pseudomonadota bacterium]
MTLNRTAHSNTLQIRPLLRGLLPLVLLILAFSARAEQTQTTEQTSAAPSHVQTSEFIELLGSADPIVVESFLLKLDQHWSPTLIPVIVETMSYSGSAYVRRQLQQLLVDKTGQKELSEPNEWYQWLWNQDEHIRPDYASFKADLYRLIDPRFEAYFRDRQDSARIRLDEVRWGGVGQDGIPPLRNPEMISADEADYLEDDNIVFGVVVNGDVRAYPKRILAWHEMFTDTFGQGEDAEPIAGVYCTLCGTVIIYKTRHQGVEHELGTSGFLYRSNKLMYDRATQSMWNTVRGEPVLGPLVDQGISLEHLSVVTTTWKEWRRRHPNTQVLSLNTGHRRDYGEGVAYANYFATDQLMFNTPFDDQRLANKQEVLALRFTAAPDKQLAIDTDYLNNNPVFHHQIGAQKFVVLTDKTGANRVYDPGDIQIRNYDGLDTATDNTGRRWRVSEQSLSAEDGSQLPTLPYHRAFWFGWHAAYPETQLIQ